MRNVKGDEKTIGARGDKERKRERGRTTREEGSIWAPICRLAPSVITKLCNRLQEPAISTKNEKFPFHLVAEGLVSSRCAGVILLWKKFVAEAEREFLITSYQIAVAR